MVGFARRFATYKRATLLLRDREALFRLLFQGPVPVQLVFAGKAHPADIAGQSFLQEVAQLSQDERFRERVVFLEDYDMGLGRAMTQGSDVWLATSRRPYEASGTSGMKALMNGVINCAVLDGWWDEAYGPDLGWAITGSREEDEALQDGQDHGELMQLLEGEVVPLYVDRCEAGVPRKWVQMMREGMVRRGASFTTSRMVGEYEERLYFP